MKLDLQRFFDACDPTRTLVMEKAEDRRYYTDFSSVRGSKMTGILRRTITQLAPDRCTCQLFTGHIGCGKSTELLRLKNELEQYNFHVVYFESTQALDMVDLDITDILLAITQQVSQSLEETGIWIRPSYFINLLSELQQIYPLKIGYSEVSLPVAIAQITNQTKRSTKLRSQIRQYLEPRTNGILNSINQEFLELAIEKLRLQGKRGLVVIVDNLDRVDSQPKVAGKPLPEYLFIDRGEQLRQLNCHIVYTIPITLMFSNQSQALTNGLGGGVVPMVLPMVPVLRRDGRDFEEGLKLLREMVQARAFPDVDWSQRLDLITEVFDHRDTLDRFCRISGGHVRCLLGLLYRCLQEEDPPLSRTCLERVIQEYKNSLVPAIRDDEWELLRRVFQLKSINGEIRQQALLQSMLVFEYQDEQGRWFGLNPALRETDKFSI
ncbi:MAG: ATP-binding protein [Coleofasciculaceae cyanobacterium]